jgi:hypothetical protein
VGGGVDAAELLGEGEGAFGFDAIGEEALGCQPEVGSGGP